MANPSKTDFTLLAALAVGGYFLWKAIKDIKTCCPSEDLKQDAPGSSISIIEGASAAQKEAQREAVQKEAARLAEITETDHLAKVRNM